MYAQYGKEYEFEAPVKLLDKLLHSMPQSPDEQLVVVSQVLSVCLYVCLSVCLSVSLALSLKILVFTFNVLFKVLVADINIGYEEIVNTQVRNSCFPQVL